MTRRGIFAGLSAIFLRPVPERKPVTIALKGLPADPPAWAQEVTIGSGGAGGGAGHRGLPTILAAAGGGPGSDGRAG